MRWLARLFALLLVAAPLHAQTFPPLSGRVVDAANIIPDDREAALDAKLKALEDNSTRQLVVTTVPSLEGYDIADYGYRLGRAWGVGQKAENNGALLIVAPNERKVRIEVGYGLEPILTDAFSSVVINTQIVPRFKEGDYPAGIDAGADALIQQLTLPPEEAAKYAASLENSSSGGESIFPILFWLFIFLFFVLPMFIGRKRRGRRYGSGPIVIWGPSSGGSSWGGGGGGGFGGGGFSGGGGSFGGGGASGGW